MARRISMRGSSKSLKRSQTRTRTVTKTNWYTVSGEVQHFFDDVLVCGSKSVPPHLVTWLEPWDLKKLEPFRAEFLSGFKTERYGVGLREGFGEAKRAMEPEIVRLIRRDIGGDHQRIEFKKTQYAAVTFKHLLLPVWVANYRYQEKLFHILVNGRTGKVSGERPWSWWKIVRLVLLVLVAVLLVSILASLTRGGGIRGKAEAPHPTLDAVCFAGETASPRPGAAGRPPAGFRELTPGGREVLASRPPVG